MNPTFPAFGAVGALATTLCINLIYAIIVYIIGGWVIKKVNKMVSKALTKKGVEVSLAGFIGSIVNVALWLCLIIAIIKILGVDTASFVALFAGAGVAIGMAMSGTLGNFAGGVMILLFKPYKVGDYIIAQGYEGVVKEIQIFNTIIVTLDNRTVIIPNGGLSTGSLENVTKQPYRRVDLNYNFAYGSDYEQVRQAIEQVQKACPLIIQEPIAGEPVLGPWQGLAEMGAACVVATRSWCKTEDYWTVYGYMNEQVYQQLKKSDFMFPHNQLDVTIVNK